jgi:hypothetical protein
MTDIYINLLLKPNIVLFHKGGLTKCNPVLPLPSIINDGTDTMKDGYLYDRNSEYQHSLTFAYPYHICENTSRKHHGTKSPLKENNTLLSPLIE